MKSVLVNWKDACSTASKHKTPTSSYVESEGPAMKINEIITEADIVVPGIGNIKPGTDVSYINSNGEKKPAKVVGVLGTRDSKGRTQVQLQAGNAKFAIDVDNIEPVDPGAVAKGDSMGDRLAGVFNKAAGAAGGAAGIFSYDPGKTDPRDQMDLKIDFVDKATGKKYGYQRKGVDWFDDQDRKVVDAKTLEMIKRHPDYREISANMQGALSKAKLAGQTQQARDQRAAAKIAASPVTNPTASQKAAAAAAAGPTP